MVRGQGFDRVLGSLHAVPYKGRLVAADALFGDMPDDEVMRYYFAELLTLIEGSDLFQVLAHLDFPRRYWPKGAHLYTEAPFEAEYRAVLRALAPFRDGLIVRQRNYDCFETFWVGERSSPLALRYAALSNNRGSR